MPIACASIAIGCGRPDAKIRGRVAEPQEIGTAIALGLDGTSIDQIAEHADGRFEISIFDRTEGPLIVRVNEVEGVLPIPIDLGDEATLPPLDAETTLEAAALHSADDIDPITALLFIGPNSSDAPREIAAAISNASRAERKVIESLRGEPISSAELQAHRREAWIEYARSMDAGADPRAARADLYARSAQSLSALDLSPPDTLIATYAAAFLLARDAQSILHVAQLSSAAEQESLRFTKRANLDRLFDDYRLALDTAQDLSEIAAARTRLTTQILAATKPTLGTLILETFAELMVAHLDQALATAASPAEIARAHLDFAATLRTLATALSGTLLPPQTADFLIEALMLQHAGTSATLRVIEKY